MKQMTEVMEFNSAILKIEPRPIGGPISPAEAALLVEQMHEEADEFRDAHIEGDTIKQIDSLIDSMYFALGGLYRLGLNSRMVEEIFTAVHTANMTKKKGRNETRGDGTAPDAIKPEGWQRPEERIAGILDSHMAAGA